MRLRIIIRRRLMSLDRERTNTHVPKGTKEKIIVKQKMIA
jgi:hypothetical protein